MVGEVAERRQPLSRSQALTFFRHWSESDRDYALREIDRVGAVGFYAVESGSYVRCNDTDGNALLWLHAGFVDYAEGLAPEQARPSNAAGLIPLSRFSPSDRGAVTPERPVEVCEVCFTARSAAGSCLCT